MNCMERHRVWNPGYLRRTPQDVRGVILERTWTERKQTDSMTLARRNPTAMFSAGCLQKAQRTVMGKGGVDGQGNNDQKEQQRIGVSRRSEDSPVERDARTFLTKRRGRFRA